jgi:hypothetical protein
VTHVLLHHQEHEHASLRLPGPVLGWLRFFPAPAVLLVVIVQALELLVVV